MPEPTIPSDTIDFIGIGAPRSGTTWLSECLRQHPDVIFPKRVMSQNRELDLLSLGGAKELNFFTRGKPDGIMTKDATNYHRGLGWYLERFDPAQPGKVRGEFSPGYLREDDSASLIKQAFPDVKLLAVLRNPADMVHSLYWFLRNAIMQDHGLSFEAAVDRGYYLVNGTYHRNLKRYFDLFAKEQILVILFDDIVNDPVGVVKQVYSFLGVRTDFVPTNLHKRINTITKPRSSAFKIFIRSVLSFLGKLGITWSKGSTPVSRWLYRIYCRLNLRKGSYPPMDPKTRGRLLEYYRDDITALETLLGRDLSAWRS